MGPTPNPDRRKEERREVSPHQEYLEERLHEFFDLVQERLRSFFAKCLMIFAVLGVSCAAGLLGFGIVLRKQSDLTDQIQAQRYDAVLSSCNETNSRNIDVNSKIDDAIAHLPAKRRDKAEKQSQAFRLIISASVPLTRDCYAYAKNRVQGEK